MASSNPSASVSRSKTSRDEIRSRADQMLRASLTRGSIPSSVSPSVNPPASVTRSRTSPGDIQSLADQMLQSSISSRSPAPADEPPPSYGSTVRSTGSTALPRDRPPGFRADSLMKPGRDVGTKSRPGSFAHASPSGMSAAEAKNRLLELQQEVGRVSSALPPRSTTGLFKTACSTDLLFLIDTTSSMGPYIDAAREQVIRIVDDIKKTFLNESQVRIAVVSYKDHGDSPNVEFLEFTTSPDEVRQFLGHLSATGGGDIPEDVVGGLQQAIAANWAHQTRCIIHIADSPGHSRALHDLPEHYDSFFRLGSEPHNLTYEPLLRQLVTLGINYAFLNITQYTDRMALAFARVYLEAGTKPDSAKLLPTNTYYTEIAPTSFGGKEKPTGGPQFDELKLGTSYNALRNLVVKTVTSSVSRTAAHLTMSWNRKGGTEAVGMTSGTAALTSIREEGFTVTSSMSREAQLETAPPQWGTPGWLSKTVVMDGFCPDTAVHSAGTLNSMMESDDNIQLGVTQLTIHTRPKPFAQGALRTASYARTAASQDRFVVKSFKREGAGGLAEMAEDMRIQALCKAFALEFNGLLKTAHPIDFIITITLQQKSKTGSTATNNCLSLEPFIEGEYIKYNTNGGWVRPDTPYDSMNRTAQAFSHFTFERSFGHFLVDDLQGVGHILTDPSIQTSDPERFKLNETNLHEDGFKFFFAVHECNDICRELGLQSNREMIISGDFRFRESWPTMEPTVCCSNKLCRRIVRLASTREDTELFPGHHWCETCWPQLETSTVSWICAAPGPNHEFAVSRFFYESQGKVAPRKCPEHVERDTTVSSASVVGGGLWSRMKDADSRASVSGRSW